MSSHSGHGNLVAGPAKLEASGRVIANFALQHLKAATTFRDRVVALECAHKGEEFADFFEDVRSYSSACITSATSSLEALINELYLNPQGKLRSRIADFELEFWGKKGIERPPILEKYQTALSIVAVKPMDEGSEYFKDALALIGIRNYLVHFRPTWDTQREREEKLIAYMQSRYELSPFPDAGSDFFTMRSMSAGCAIWAVKVAIRFMRAFSTAAHIDDEKMEGFWKLES